LKEIEVLYLEDKDLIAPTQGYEGDFGTDIYASEGRLITHSSYKSVIIPTNLRVAFDPLEAGMKVVLRSGVAVKTPLIISNSPGVVEGTYRGQVGIIVRNTFADNQLVDFAFDISGNKVPLNQIPSPVKKEARRFFEEEMEFLGFSNAGEGNAAKISKTLVPLGTVYVPKGARIAQIYFSHKITPTFTPVKELPESSRGANGYGSSGVTKK